MRKGTAYDIRPWVRHGGLLKNLLFAGKVNLFPAVRPTAVCKVESCIFEGDVVWRVPRIAEMQLGILQVDKKLVFQGCTFKKPISWAQCRFIKPLVFFSCRFEGCVDFTRSCFHGASFQDCTFDEKVFFEDAAFLRVSNTNLPHCHNRCANPPEDNSHCSLSDCRDDLNKPAERAYCANFRATVFRDGAEFDWVRFDVPACFFKAEFHGSTTFLQSAFGFPDRVDYKKEIRPISINLSYAEIFGAIEFHQGLGWTEPWRSEEEADLESQQGGAASGEASSRDNDHDPVGNDRPAAALLDRPRPLNRVPGGDIPNNEIRADMRYVHIHKSQGLRFHSENLSECFVLGTNLEACHFINVRWPMVDSYFPLQFEMSLTLFKYLLGILRPLDLDVKWFAGFGHARDLISIILILPFHLVQSFIATAVRVTFRWMVRHDKPDSKSGNGRPVQQPQSTAQCSRWIALKSHLWFRWLTLSNYFLSCASHEQHGIFDHKEQIRQQKKSFPSANGNNQGHRPISGDPPDLYQIIKSWRDKWTQLSRAYRDLKSAYEGNKDYIYASDFHFAEKELRRINHEVPRHTRLQLFLFWLVSGYGERVLRPIWWFIAIWILGALPYYLWGTPAKKEDLSISVPTTAYLCEPNQRQCDHGTKTEVPEEGEANPKQLAE